jgi:hypothetical protein
MKEFAPITTTMQAQRFLIKKIEELRKEGRYSDAAYIDFKMFESKGSLPELLKIINYANIIL